MKKKIFGKMSNKKIVYLGGNFEFQYKDYSVENISTDYRATVLHDVSKLIHEPKDGLVPLSGDTMYCGPYYFYENGLDGANVVKNEIGMIDKCTHAVFVIDNTNIPGTITEIVHAAMKGKDIAIFYVKQPLDEGEPEKNICSANWYPLEFARQMANAYMVECADRDMAKILAYNYVEFIKRN